MNKTMVALTVHYCSEVWRWSMDE